MSTWQSYERLRVCQLKKCWQLKQMFLRPSQMFLRPSHQPLPSPKNPDHDGDDDYHAGAGPHAPSCSLLSSSILLFNYYARPSRAQFPYSIAMTDRHTIMVQQVGPSGPAPLSSSRNFRESKRGGDSRGHLLLHGSHLLHDGVHHALELNAPIQ